MATRLADADVSRLLAALPRWQRDGGHLARTLAFADFVTAFGFMTSVAFVAERLNHHPEWENVYRTVKIRLTTHDVAGISGLDFELARAIDAAATRFGC